MLAVSPKARLTKVDYGKNPKDYQAAPIRITFHYEIPDYALPCQEGFLIKPFATNNLYNQVKSYLRIDTSLEERKYGFKDACSHLVEIDEVLRLPAGYACDLEERSRSIDGPAASWEGDVHLKGNQLRLTQRLALKKRVYEADDWENFRSAVNAHKDFGNYLFIHKK